jgi:hypothetical protein
MSDNKSTEYGKHTTFDLFAAELTDVAYRVVLRHGVEDAWIELEIALWRSLADTVERWRHRVTRSTERRNL